MHMCMGTLFMILEATQLLSSMQAPVMTVFKCFQSNPVSFLHQPFAYKYPILLAILDIFKICSVLILFFCSGFCNT